MNLFNDTSIIISFLITVIIMKTRHKQPATCKSSRLKNINGRLSELPDSIIY